MSEFKKDENKTYRVVKIPSEDEIVINAGTNSCIKKDDRFNIIGKGISVKDPETGEILGELNGKKAVVEVTQVFDKMCICKNVERDAPSVVANMARMMMPFYSSRKPLNVDIDEISGYVAEDQKAIRVGDKAEHLIIIENEDATTAPSTEALQE